MKTSALLILMVTVGLLSSCVSTGMHTSTHLTNVQLTSGNYRIIARSVSGEAKAGYILGASFGVGMYSQVIGIARVSGDKALYKTAMDNLWKNFETKYGSVEEKRVALVNIRYDVDALNLLVYTEPRITIEADVIEFTE